MGEADAVTNEIGMSAKRLDAVRDRLNDAAAKGGEAPVLIAVSKTHDAARIRPVIEAGQRDFGENRVQEAQGKWPGLREDHSDVRLHLIGPLQTNKARDAVALFDVIHTLDREKLARVLAEEMDRAGRRLPVFVQVDIGREPQKAGVAPDEAVAFAARARDVHGHDVAGLMCIPPQDEAAGPHFRALKALADEAGLKGLSMGMSGDYETAIREGATHVRVGSAIFGARGGSSG